MTDVAETMKQIELYAGLANLIPLADAQAVLDEIGRTETLMPILDPTAYRNIMGNIPGHARLVRAFVTFRSALEEIVRAEQRGKQGEA